LTHDSLDFQKDAKFFDFSWEDMAAKDLPAAVNTIAKMTGKKVNYIGYSQGTIVMLAALSDQAVYSKFKANIESVSLLAPLTYIDLEMAKNFRSLLGALSSNVDFMNIASSVTLASGAILFPTRLAMDTIMATT